MSSTSTTGNTKATPAVGTKASKAQRLPPPSNLQDYVDRVSSLLDKSFRDDTRILVAARGSVVASVSRPLVEAEGRPQDAKREFRAATLAIPNYFILSPRFMVSNAGTIEGKLKVSTKMRVEDMCGVYMRLFADTVGRFTTKCSISDIQNSGVNLNLVLQSPALLYQPGHVLRKSIAEIVAEVDRGQYYGRVGSTWSTSGERRVTADGCVRFANVHIGCGMDRISTGAMAPSNNVSGQHYSGYSSIPATSRSYITNQDDLENTSGVSHHSSLMGDQVSSEGGFNVSRATAEGAEAYVGIGCFGPSWSMSAMMYRSHSKWSEVHLTAFQNFNRKAVVAISYQLDLHRRQTEFNLGIFRRFHLPYWGQSFVGACKVSNTGVGSLLVDMEFDQHTKIGVVSRHDLLMGGRPSLGLIASVSMD